MESPIITLTTDWSTTDFYVGRVKGRLFSSIANARVVDVSHNVPVADKVAAAFVVRNACREFPAGTIHLVDVCAGRATEGVVVVEADGQYYIMVDNGLPYMVFGDNYTRAVAVTQFQLPPAGVFLAYDLYCPLAAMLASGATLDELGETCQLTPAMPYSYISDPKFLKIYITYIDSYGNAYLGISHSDFERERAGRSFKMFVRECVLTEVVLAEVSQSSASKVDLQLTVSSAGNLILNTTQLSQNASRLFGLQVRQMILVMFS